jgi:hypothetical protein
MLDRTVVLLVYKTSVSIFCRLIKVDLKPSSVYFQEPLSPVLLSTNLKGQLTPLESP